MRLWLLTKTWTPKLDSLSSTVVTLRVDQLACDGQECETCDPSADKVSVNRKWARQTREFWPEVWQSTKSR